MTPKILQLSYSTHNFYNSLIFNIIRNVQKKKKQQQKNEVYKCLVQTQNFLVAPQRFS